MNVKDFLDSKNISLTSLLNEYATLYSQKKMCCSKAIDLIDESEITLTFCSYQKGGI